MSLLWVRAATYPVHVEPPPVEELPAHEFVKKYPPGAYGGTWDAVAKLKAGGVCADARVEVNVRAKLPARARPTLFRSAWAGRKRRRSK